MKTINYDAVPSAAFTFNVGETSFESRNETDRTAKIDLFARAGTEIEHWFWGRIIHDMSGIRHKTRMPVDYGHNTDEVLGYINRFEPSDEGLRLKGALTPFSDGDRASEVIYKARAGVPYEASIKFGGDDEEYQIVREGESAAVNGFNFAGPGVIVRRWNLRGVAICPYGADASTEAKVFADGDTRKINIVGVNDMKDDVTTDEAELATTDEAVVEAPEAASDAAELEACNDEGNASDAPEGDTEAPEAPEAPETAEDETEEADPAEEEGADEPADELTAARDEFSRIRKEFGDAIAADVFASGGDYNTALKLAYDRLKDENKELEKRAEESIPGGRPAALGMDVDRKPVDAWKAAQRK